MLEAADPSPVRTARAHAVAVLAGAPRSFVGDVELVVDELVANALDATAKAPHPPPGVLPTVEIGVEDTGRYVHVLVRDPVPTKPEPREPYADEHGDMHGYGLSIADAFTAARWTVLREHDKTEHAVLVRPGLTLTAAELEAIRR